MMVPEDVRRSPKGRCLLEAASMCAIVQREVVLVVPHYLHLFMMRQGALISYAGTDDYAVSIVSIPYYKSTILKPSCNNSLLNETRLF